MSQPSVPRDLQQFIARYLPSVERLEAFIALQKNPMRWWRAGEMAAEIHVPQATAADLLEGLASDNFLAVKISDDILYRFNPATDALKSISTSCAELYARDRTSMIYILIAATLSPIDE